MFFFSFVVVFIFYSRHVMFSNRATVKPPGTIYCKKAFPGGIDSVIETST